MGANCADLGCLRLEGARWSGRRHTSPGRQDGHGGHGHDQGHDDDRGDDDLQ